MTDRKSAILTRAILAAMCVSILAFASACGEKSETVDTEDIRKNRVILLLDWTPNANHAGIYQAVQDGSFDKRALDVDVQVPSDAAAIIKQVEAGRADLGLTYASYVLTAREAGSKIKAIGAVVNRPLNSIIWLKKSGIKSIKGLRGKTVGVSGDGESNTLNTILAENGVPKSSVEQINVNMDLQPALVSGKVDATITGYWNVEGVQLKQAKRPATVIPVDEAGSPTYDELVIIAKEDNLKDTRRTEIYRRFLAGLADGTPNAAADPQEAFESLSTASPDIQKDASFYKASLAVTLPILAQKNSLDEGNPFGWQNPSTWSSYGKWMKDNGELTQTGVNYTDAITNDLLPGEGPESQ